MKLVLDLGPFHQPIGAKGKCTGASGDAIMFHQQE